MRKLLISLAAAGAALAIATPAAAQFYPRQPFSYGYNNWDEVRALQARINRIDSQINWLDRRDRIGGRGADRLRFEADRLEQRLHYAARGGLNPNEARDIQYGIGRLEQRVQYAVANGYGRYDWRDRNDRWHRDNRWNREGDDD